MTNGDLIERLLRRDESVIGEVIALCEKMCRRIAWNILDCAEDTEEVLNDTWLKVWESIPPNRPTSLIAYTGRLTRNLALNRYRHTHRACRSRDALIDWETLTENPHLFEETVIEDPVAETVEAIELSRAIADFLRTLPTEERVLFIRRYWMLEDNDAISEGMGLRRGTVNVKLHRIRQQLRKYLERGNYL